MAAQRNQKVASGNRYVVVMNDITVGMMQNIDMNDDYGPEPASGIGDIHVQENVPTMARHTLSCETMILKTGSLRAAGIAFENGDDALQGLVFDVMVLSKDDGSLLRKYTGVSYASGSVQVRKHAIITSNATFNALDVSGTGA